MKIKWTGSGVVSMIGAIADVNPRWLDPNPDQRGWEPSHASGRVMLRHSDGVVPEGYTAFGKAYRDAFSTPEEIVLPAGTVVRCLRKGDAYTTAMWEAEIPVGK